MAETSSISIDNDVNTYNSILKDLLEFSVDFCRGLRKLCNDMKLKTEINKIFKEIAENGFCRYPLIVMKVIIVAQLEDTIDMLRVHTHIPHKHQQFADDIDNDLKNITLNILHLTHLPITIQRLCEVLLNPPYQSTYQLLACIYKLISVKGLLYEVVHIPEDVNLNDFTQIQELENIIDIPNEGNNSLITEEWMADLDSEETRSRSASSSHSEHTYINNNNSYNNNNLLEIEVFHLNANQNKKRKTNE